jgi:hypothetical protein
MTRHIATVLVVFLLTMGHRAGAAQTEAAAADSLLAAAAGEQREAWLDANASAVTGKLFDVLATRGAFTMVGDGF